MSAAIEDEEIEFCSIATTVSNPDEDIGTNFSISTRLFQDMSNLYRIFMAVALKLLQ